MARRARRALTLTFRGLSLAVLFFLASWALGDIAYHLSRLIF